MSNRIATTRLRTAADALLTALAERFDTLRVMDERTPIGGDTVPIYTSEDREGVIHVLMAGGEDTPLLDLAREFAAGFLATRDGTSETQGYEPEQTPMSVSPSWRSDGTGFRE